MQMIAPPAATRVLRREAGGLDEHELLAAILEPGLGPVRAREGAARLLRGFPAEGGRGPLRRLSCAALTEIVGVGGITATAATRLSAALELGRRYAMEPTSERCRLCAPRDVYERFYPRMRDLKQEEFWVVVLNTQQEVIREAMVSRGSVSEATVAPADVFRPAIQEGGHHLIVVHNHPSGEPTPSKEDRAITNSLEFSARLLGLFLSDHVIMGEQRYFSFHEAGLLMDPGPHP